MSGDQNSDGKRNHDGRRSGAGLPPPAFPPGERRNRAAQVARSHAADATGGLDRAFISPDEPLPGRSTVDEAMISPDEPIVRVPRGASPADPPMDPDDVVVTGMGDDPHLGPEDAEAVRSGDPYVREVAEKVAKLAEALKRKGEAGLRTSPDMDRFEATLRAYCVGFIAGRRAADDPSGGY